MTKGILFCEISNMRNIVDEIIELAGGYRKLANMHNVTPQSVILWRKNGYFPLKQIPVVLKNFPSITSDQLVKAYKLEQGVTSDDN